MIQTQQPKHTPQNRIIGDHTRQIERLTREKAYLLAVLEEVLPYIKGTGLDGMAQSRARAALEKVKAP